MASVDLSSLLIAARAGDRRALARLISRIEGRPEDTDDLLASVYRGESDGHVVGITGAPGAGKSTLADRLVGLARTEGRTVAVLAIDPSSPFTGGALLGDRVRMQGHVDDPGVYVRSMSSRGRVGGLADAATRTVPVLLASGFDLVLLETVGVGQTEVEVAETADTVVVVVAPGMGDGVQAAKAGLFEVGDVFAVNKRDRPGAGDTVRDLTEMVAMGAGGSWSPPVVACSAATGEGVEAVWTAITDHASHLGSGSAGLERRRRQAAAQVRRAATASLHRSLDVALDDATVDEVARRRLDPWTAARRLLSALAR